MAQPPYKRAHFLSFYRPRRRIPLGAVRSSGRRSDSAFLSRLIPPEKRDNCRKIRDVPLVIGTKIHEKQKNRKEADNNSPGRKPAQANEI